jgi:signal transduction histidine kinase
MASEELAFLHRHRGTILRRWKEHIRQSVSPDFFGQDSLITDDLLGALYGYILEALDQNHFHNLNRTFDTLVDRAYARYISIGDVTGLLFGFIHATESTLHLDAAGSAQYDYLKRVLGRFSRDLRKVYSERVGRQASETLTAHREHVMAKWQRDVPTEMVSTHFAVLSREEVGQFVAETFRVANTMLLGTEDQATEVLDDDGRPKTVLAAYLDDQTAFFEPRGFAISSIERAILHLEEIAEPILFVGLHGEPAVYRKSMWVVGSAMKRLTLAFSEHYNQRMMNNYYEEVSKMLHRIKNKITPAQTGLQTILPVEYEGRVQEGMLLTPEEADTLDEALALVGEMVEAAAAAGDACAAGVASAVPPAVASLAGAAAKAKSALSEAQEARAKLVDTGIVGEFIRDALEAAEISSSLAKDLQEVQNELIRREPPVWEQICINDLVRRAFDESAVDAKQKGLQYDFTEPDENAYVFGIERQLFLPLAQVISNAIKYTPGPPLVNGQDGGNGTGAHVDDGLAHRVLVQLSTDRDAVLFSCSDSGIGIPAGEEELVFALCERCSNAKEFDKHGSGTGLYHDRKIIEQHNGRIWVESAGIGQGSTFYVRLPRFYPEDGKPLSPEP